MGSYNRLTYTSPSISSESEGAGGPWGAGRGRILGSYNRLTYTSSSISSEYGGAGGALGGWGEDTGQQQQTHLHLIYVASLVSLGGLGGPWGAGGEDTGQLQQAHLHLIQHL